MRACAALLVLVTCLATPARAAQKCETELARLESADKRVFSVERYGSGAWTEQHDGRRLTYFVHAWQGAERGAARTLTFTEIPGTSGPNWGSVSDPKEIKARIAWRKLGGVELDENFRVYGGPLEGEWTVDGRIGRRLVVLSGARNEKGVFGRHFYVLENGRLKHLRSVEVEREFPQKLE